MNIVGSAFKFMFCTLSAEDGEMYMEMFRDFEKKQDQQEFIAEKQTTLIKASFEQMKNIAIEHENQLNLIEIEVDQMKEIFSSIQTYVEQNLEVQYKVLKLQNRLYSLIDYFTLLIIQFERKQSMFLEAIATSLQF